MPICPSCRLGYDPTEASCPKCGAPKPPEVAADYPSLTGYSPSQFSPGADSSGYRCGNFAMFCLHFARLAAMLGVVVAIVSGCVLLFSGHIGNALLDFFVYTPVAIGGVVSFSLSIKYARYE